MHALDLAVKIEGEVDRLVIASYRKELKNRLANVVLFHKKNGQIRFYIDFLDLNKACPKDDFLVPLIKWFIDTTLAIKLYHFMNEYFIYNQIKMQPEDIMTAFPLLEGVFCHQVMQFGLKNVRLTYQRAMTIILKKCLGSYFS